MSNENQFRDEQEMVFDPTEYDPNSKDITDDPNFPAPKCGVCGVPWADHMGIMGVCLWNKALKEDLKDLREENAKLLKERDEAQVDQRLIDELWERRLEMSEMKKQIELLQGGAP